MISNLLFQIRNLQIDFLFPFADYGNRRISIKGILEYILELRWERAVTG
jgi:hypothetical protein